MVFYDTSLGTMVGEQLIEAPAGREGGDQIEVACMAAHNLEPVIVVGLESGDFITYDYRQQKQL